MALHFKKLNPVVGEQARVLIANHQSRFRDPTDMKLFADGLCSDLRFDPKTSGNFEAAVNELAWFIGIRGQRPEKNHNEGPDNLWALPNGSFLVIECKNGVITGNGISKKDAGQLGQSLAWFFQRYPASTSVPIIIHTDNYLGKGASIVEGMRVMAFQNLEKLRNNLNGFANQLINPDVAKNASEVAMRLGQFKLNADAFVNAFTVAVKPWKAEDR